MKDRKNIAGLAAIVASSVLISPSTTSEPYLQNTLPKTYSQNTQGKGKQPDATSQNIRYAIIASNATANDSEWKGVVTSLQKKYPGATVHTYQTTPRETLPGLQERTPTHIAYVAQPKELSLQKLPLDEHRPTTQEEALQAMQQEYAIVRDSNRGIVLDLATKIDEDPYPDARVGIITGLDAKDAQKLVTANPLTAKKPFFKTAYHLLDEFNDGIGYTSTSQGVEDGSHFIFRRDRIAGVTTETKDYRAGPELLRRLNNGMVDFLVTGGHANSYLFQLGHNSPDYFFAAMEDGVLAAIDETRKNTVANITNSQPLIYLSLGSCQSGRLKDPEKSLPLSMIHSAHMITGISHSGNVYNGIGMVDSDIDPLFATSQTPTISDAHFQGKIALAHNIERLQTKRQGDTPSLTETGNTFTFFSSSLIGDPALEARLGLSPTREALLNKTHRQGTKNNTKTHTFELQVNPNHPNTKNYRRGLNTPQVFLLDTPLPEDAKITATKGLEYKIIDNAVVFDVSHELNLKESHNPTFVKRKLTPGQTWTLQVSHPVK